MKNVRLRIKGLLLVAMVLLSGLSVNAQNNEDDEMKHSLFHMSFITPLGTNGIDSWNTINHFSINLFAGFSGGLEGVEWAGFANGLKGDMKGIQMAGFCNNTFGEAIGLEIAGFYNYNHKRIQGIQAAGFANGAMGDVEGAQLSGFANHSQGSSMIQVAGFSNTSMGKKAGFQAAGFANFSRGSGLGTQLAGFANTTTGHIKGIQVAGFVNVAKKISGIQIAPFNVADTLEDGIAIGVWSIVRNGYKTIQIGGNETLYGEISLKSGVKRFYNIVSVGASVRNNSVKWGWGYGIGSLWGISQRLDLGLEAMVYHINEDQWWTNNSNLLNRVNLSANYQLTKTLGVYAGPSWNVWVSHNRRNLASIDPTFGGSYWYDKTTTRNRVAMYPGFTAGVRVSL